jgi:hypothetical protein
VIPFSIWGAVECVNNNDVSENYNRLQSKWGTRIVEDCIRRQLPHDCEFAMDTRKSARMVKHRAKQSLGQRSEFAARTDQEVLERTEVARVK